MYCLVLVCTEVFCILEHNDSIFKMNAKFAAILFVLSIILYMPAIYNGYSLDDEYVIFNNKLVQKGVQGIPNILSQPYARSYEGAKASGYRPLPVIIGAIEFQFFGQNPKVSHAINIIMYAVTMVLLYYFLSIILGGQYPMIPMISVLLFAFHPIHSEVVINVKNRDVLAAFSFAILFWISMLKFERSSSRKYCAFWIILGLISILGAALSNPVFIVMVGLVIPILYFFSSFSLQRIAILTVVLGGMRIVLNKFSSKLLGDIDKQKSYMWENPLYADHTLIDSIGLGLSTLGKYIMLLIVPYPLSHYYGFNQIAILPLYHPFAILCFLFFVGLLIVFVKELKAKSLIGFVAAFFLLAIVPFSNIIKPGPGIVAERWVYTASLGFVLGLTLLLLYLTIGTKSTWKQAIDSKKKGILALVLIIILGAYSVIIRDRIPDWKDMYTLALADVEVVPNSVKVNATIGSLLITKFIEATDKEPIRQKAEMYLKKALAIDSTYGPAWNNYGLFVESRGDLTTATRCFEKALIYKSIDEKAIDNLGRVYVATNRYQDMIHLYEQYLGQKGIASDIYLDYATHLSHAGMLQNALAINDTAQKLMPQRLSVVYDNRARILYENGDKPQALLYWEKAYNFDISDPATAYKLMNAYLEIGDTANSEKYKKIFKSLTKKNNSNF